MHTENKKSKEARDVATRRASRVRMVVSFDDGRLLAE
jgi:hypothetical protein